jgi:hypothetical protein
VNDEPREFWESKTEPHFIFTNTGGRTWEAAVQETTELWERRVRVL